MWLSACGKLYIHTITGIKLAITEEKDPGGTVYGSLKMSVPVLGGRQDEKQNIGLYC